MAVNEYSFCFQAYGVRVKLVSSRKKLLDRAVEVVDRTLLGMHKTLGCSGEFDHVFRFGWNNVEGYFFDQNGKRVASIRWAKGVFNYFDSLVRMAVAEYAEGLVFLHAGVVAWNDRAIVIPGDSFSGKSTLVTELVRQGATYYSDDFAIVDKKGLVHPFARPINRRTDDGRYRPYTVDIDEIAGKIGKSGIEIGALIITEYQSGVAWKPKILTVGEGIMAMIPHTIPLRKNTDFSLSVLKILASRALILKTKRPEASSIARKLLDFVDNTLH